ncbi:aminotransferase class I/II-fold pyridoxal phosphate-dependent enzyme [Anaerolineales bacterium HSG25]|nr:aminotransferase class I/II-fold pyridoxal phosphate-dependent enzyme [Anaerolineales bacterium HSG25]
MRSFISNRVQQIPPSGIRRFFDIAATMDDVISLGIGEPDFITPQVVVEAGINSLKAGHTHYTSNNGMIELRSAISKHLQRLYEIEYDPALEVLATVGVSEAMYLALTAILNPGDEVIVPQPCFVSYAAEVSLAGGTPVPIATRVDNNFQVTADEIEAAITRHTKALLIGYPNNPTGAVLERETLEKIAKVAQKHDILVISDEIYDRLVYDIEHVCFASLPGMWDRTILLGGFSKAYAMTGWRLGYAAAPTELLGAMKKIHQYTIMSAPTTAQEAALTAIEHGEEPVEMMRQKYDRRRRLIVGGLNSIGLRCFEPRGAFYAFPSVRGSGMDDAEFAERLLDEERVAVIPGRAFGIGGAGYVRCSYATSYEKIEQALEGIAKFVQRHG